SALYLRAAGGVVVVGQLFALLDVARGPDPDRPVDDVDVAVGATGVVDETRDVAPDVGVDDPSVVEREAPDRAALQVSRFALPALLVGDLLPGVIDDALVLRDVLGREHAPAGNLRTFPYDHATTKIASPCTGRCGGAEAGWTGPRSTSAGRCYSDGP